MKKWIILLTLLSSAAWAQSVNVKDVDASSDTTIQIKKGTQNIDNEYEIVAGEEDISGDPAALLKEARENWKKACNDWKKETKELNKENMIITLSCGKMSCTTQAMESSCSSKGTHKIRVKVK